ncbi:hypothetical protein PMAYCL1PPCAC_05700, partial [Pristionchus mayeri]
SGIPESFPLSRLVPSTMASSSRMDGNVVKPLITGATTIGCQQCKRILEDAQEREHELMAGLEKATLLAAKYKTELEIAQAAIEKMVQTSHFTVENEPSEVMHKVEAQARRMSLSLQRQSSSTEEPKVGNLYARRKSSAECSIVGVAPMYNKDAPPSFEEKKWWKGEGPAQPCPRGCYYLEISRRGHYKKRHYNAYYAFVNSEDNYSERDRWMCTLFGDKKPGMRVCVHCERHEKKGAVHSNQLELAAHIKVRHPDEFDEIAEEHARHCRNTFTSHMAPQLPNELDLLLMEKDRKFSLHDDNGPTN